MVLIRVQVDLRNWVWKHLLNSMQKVYAFSICNLAVSVFYGTGLRLSYLLEDFELVMCPDLVVILCSGIVLSTTDVWVWVGDISKC